MKTGSIQILDLDFEFKLWKNKLYFYQVELEILGGRMLVLKREHPEIIIKQDYKELMESQSKQIKAILNTIETLEQEMAEFAEDYPVNEKHYHVLAHENIRIEMKELAEQQRFINQNIYPALCLPKLSASF